MFSFKKPADTDDDNPITEIETDDAASAVSSKRPLIAAVAAGLVALIGLLLLLSGLNADESEASGVREIPTGSVLVFDQTLTAGTTVAEMLSAQDLPVAIETRELNAIVPGAVATADDLAALGDVMLEVDVFPGEQVLASRFIPRDDFASDAFTERVAPVEIPEGHHTLTVSLPATRALGGFIRPGDNVSVLMSFGGNGGNITGLVMNSVEVINVTASLGAVQALPAGQVEGELGPDGQVLGVAAAGEYVVTFALTPDELTTMTYGVEFGRLMLAVAVEEEYHPELLLLDDQGSVLGTEERPTSIEPAQTNVRRSTRIPEADDPASDFTQGGTDPFDPPAADQAEGE